MRHLGSLFLVLVIAAASSGCAFGDASGAADAAVDDFHARYNGGQFYEIYAGASDEFRNATKEFDWNALLDAVRRKLGKIESSSRTFVNVNATTAGTTVNQVFSTKFTEGTAEERFTWAIRSGKALLVGYRINSNLLITK